MKKNEHGLTDDQINSYVTAKQDLARAEKSISDTVLAACGFSKGDIVENIYNGLHYKIDSVSCYMRNIFDVSISIQASRYYRTGRKVGRTAYSNTFLNSFDVKKVETDEKE